MKKFYIISLILLAFSVLFSGALSVQAKTQPSALVDKALGLQIPDEKMDYVFQISSYDGYQKGYYKTGESSIDAGKKFGNFGFGLLPENKGAVIFDTKNVYSAKNFTLEALSTNEYMPVAFGLFKYFGTDDRASLKNVSNITELCSALDKKLETVNYFVAVKAKGKFKNIVLKAGTNETKTLQNIKGELIGFRMPDFYAKAAPEGYTFWFISEDRTTGAEVYELNADIISFYIDYSDRIELILPKYKSFKVKDFSQYQPQIQNNKLAKDKKKTAPKDMQQIMNSSRTNEPTPEELMQMVTPKMTF